MYLHASLHMAHPTRNLVILVAVVTLLAAGSEASGIGFDLHHRSSPVVRRWAESRGHDTGAWWPADAEQGSPEYYSELARHDRALFARRGLASSSGQELLTFADGNMTFRMDGYLHYAQVELGTPSTKFLVALDTGSDLFWVPCDCKQCASTANVTGPGGPELVPYSPRQSSTSKTVTCDNALCDRPNACAALNTTSCPYKVSYVSANTSSSGVLVEDVLHLAGENPTGQPVQAPIVFGCGQVQTGSFLDGGVVDGLMGLGMAPASVPSVLAAGGLVASDSFSMCFSPDGVGRINFGDAGGRGQAETPFIPSSFHPSYNISVTAINVGSDAAPVAFAAVVDSGTSFTYLNDPAYTLLATNFNSQVNERRANLSLSVPFEYCYELSPGQTDVNMPAVSLRTKGGAEFPVTHPFITIAGQTNGQLHAVGYCLAIIKNDISIDIIGQNFMTGLKVVFDRERSVLGWQEFDCYKYIKTEGGGSVGSAPEPAGTPINPRQNNATNPLYPGAAPVPSSASSSHSNGRPFGGLSFLSFVLAAAAMA